MRLVHGEQAHAAHHEIGREHVAEGQARERRHEQEDHAGHDVEDARRGGKARSLHAKVAQVARRGDALGAGDDEQEREQEHDGSRRQIGGQDKEQHAKKRVEHAHDQHGGTPEELGRPRIGYDLPHATHDECDGHEGLDELVEAKGRNGAPHPHEDERDGKKNHPQARLPDAGVPALDKVANVVKA